MQRNVHMPQAELSMEGIKVISWLVEAGQLETRHPRLRTVIDGNKVKIEAVSIALAIETPHGLMAPGVRQAYMLSLEQLRDSVNESNARTL